MDAELDEYRLSLRACEGDQEALAELVERARVRLFALAYAELRDYEDAQDAVAAAFCQVCLHIRELRDPGRVRAWLNSIVRNQAHMLRRGAHGASVPLEEAVTRDDAKLPSLLRLDIERALERIPREHAMALRLFYLEERSVREIARAVGRPEGTIKRWLHLGRQHLALHLEDYAPMAAPTVSPTAALIHTSLAPELVRQVTSALEAGHYDTRVLLPSNPFALVDSLRECRIVVLDEWIGERSALELVLHLKARPETQRLPLYLLCSAPSDFTVAAYYTAGAHRLLDKERPESIARLTTPIDRRAMSGQWFRFSESAKQVLWHAQAEARRLGERECVGPEHVLLGLVHDADTAAAHILERLGISRESIRAAIEQQIAPGESITEPGEMFLTQEGYEPVGRAKEEAESLPFLGTQHLLVGFLRSSDSLATRVLTALGADLETVRVEVLRMQAEASTGAGSAEEEGAGSGRAAAGQ